MAFDDITTRLNIVEGDTSGIDAAERSERALADLSTVTNKADGALSRLGKTQRAVLNDMKKSAIDLGAVNRRQFDLSSRLAESALRDSKAQVNAIQAQERAYRDLIEATRAVANEEGKRRNTPQTSGGASSTIRGEAFGKIGQIANLAQIPGGAEAGQAISVLIEGRAALSQLGEVGKTAFTSIKAGEGVLGSLASVLQTAVPGLSATAAGIGAITLAGGALIAIGAGVVLAFAAISQAAADAAKNAKELADQIVSQSQAQASAEQKLQQGDILGLLAERQTLSNELAAQRVTLQSVRDRIAEEEKNSNFIGPARLVGDLERELTTSLETLDQSFLNTSTRFYEVNEALSQAEPTLKAAADATFVASQSQERLNTTLKQSGSSIAEVEAREKALTDQRAQTAQQLAALEQQEAELRRSFEETLKVRKADRDLSASREGEAGALRIARANQDLNAVLQSQQSDHSAKMQGIAADGNATLLGLQSSIATKQVDSAKAVLDVQAALATEAQDASKRYQREELQRLDQFNLSKLQRDRAFRLRADAAVQGNDVEALLSARRDRNIASKEASENFGLESKNRDSAFNAEKESRDAAAAERIANIQTELATFITATQERIKTEAIGIQERQKLEAASFAAAQKADAANRALKSARDAEDNAIRNRIANEDLVISESRAQAALNAQLARIDTEQAKLTEVATAAATARQIELTLLELIIQKGQTALTALNQNNTSSATAGLQGFLGNIGSTLTGLLGLPGFAEGGPVKRGKPIIVGERRAEVFVPHSDGYIQPSLGAFQRAGAGAGGGRSVTVSIASPTINVGEMVTPDGAKRIAMQIMEPMMSQIVDLVEEAMSS